MLSFSDNNTQHIALCKERKGNFKPTFNLPNFTGRYALGGTAGTYVSESLPNITGTIALNATPMERQTGALSQDRTERQSAGGIAYASGTVGTLNFNASSSSSAYQNGAKVRPDSVEVKYCIKY